MRVVYIPPTVEDFDLLFSNRGSGLSDIRVYHNRGGSLLSVVGRFARYALPFLKSIIVPEVGNFAKNVADDIGQGRSIKRVLKKRGIESVLNVGKRVVKKARGGRVRKNKSVTKKQITKKKNVRKNCVKKNDIFNTNKFHL